MPRKLNDLYLKFMALVDRGANQHADIVLAKRDPAAPDPKEPEMPEPTPDAATVAKLAKLEADTAALQKRLDESDAARVKAEKDAADERAKNAEQLAKMAERDQREECIRKAVGLSALGKADDLGSLLFAVQKGVSKEDFVKIETLLKSANEQLRQNKLFVSIGADAAGGATPEDKLNAMAKAHAEKHNLPFAKAYDAVCKTDEGKALYTAYRKEG